MDKNTYLNTANLESLENIKKDIQNLNSFYSKTFQNFKNIQQQLYPNSPQENISKQKEDSFDKSNNRNCSNNKSSNAPKDSRKLKQPIINEEYFNNFIKNETRNKFMDSKNQKFSSFNYKTLSETLKGCGAYPENARKYIWIYLLSLPNNMGQFSYFSGKGIHPLYQDFKKIFPIDNNSMLIRMQKLCSLIAYWSPNVGQISYLPNLIYPFAKCFPGDDIFVFETVMALLLSVYKYCIEFYPNFPITHIKLVEELIKKETSIEIEKIFSEQKIPFKELIWRVIQYSFSESFKKDDWLSLMDFLITYNHRPEMILYFTASFFIYLKSDLLANKNNQTKLIVTVLDNRQRRQIKKICDYSIFLYKKYNKTLQEFVYEPYIPQSSCTKYRTLMNLPMEFYNTMEQLRNDYYRGELDLDINQKLIQNYDYKTILEKKYRELCIRDKEIEFCQKDILEQEKMKNEILKWNLDIISHQRNMTLKKMEEIK